MGFIDEIKRRLTVTTPNRKSRVALCVGLDPHASELSTLDKRERAQATWNFCRDMIDSTESVAACYKANSAFFEASGSDGFAVLERVCLELRSRMLPVLLDAKRGDIASTAEAYAEMAFDVLNCDGLTVSPYMGSDSIEAFCSHKYAKGRGVFVLCKTSNPGSNDIQTLEVLSPTKSINGSEQTPLPLYLHVADMCGKLNADFTADGSGGCVGLVVGATDADALRRVRQRHPEMWILAPGVGSQGGTMEAVLQNGYSEGGDGGLIIPISRAISRSQDKKATALQLSESLTAALNRNSK